MVRGHTQKHFRGYFSNTTKPLKLHKQANISHLSSCCHKDPYLAHRTCAPSCQRYSYWAGTQGLESWNSAASGMWGHFHQERHPGFRLSCSCSRVRKTNEAPNRPIPQLSQEPQEPQVGQETRGMNRPLGYPSFTPRDMTPDHEPYLMPGKGGI